MAGLREFVETALREGNGEISPKVKQYLTALGVKVDNSGTPIVSADPWKSGSLVVGGGTLKSVYKGCPPVQ